MRRLPPLNSVRVFEAVVRLGSFTAAARELGVTQGAVSHQIKVIEDFLGVALFKAQGRGMKATGRATEYALEVRGCLDRLGRATDQMIEPAAANVIRVNSLQSFATRWLIPRLGEFHARHPGLEVRVSISSLPVDQLSEPFDIVFRRHTMLFPGHECRVMLDDACVLVCAPETLARHPVTTYADLSQHTLLCSTLYADSLDQWLALAGVGAPPPERRYFEKFYIALQAAIDGLGIVLAPIRHVAGDIERGRLVAPFAEPRVACASMEILFPKPQNCSARTQAFIRWVLDQARTQPGARTIELGPKAQQSHAVN